MILQTERLTLREAGPDDAAFILELLNAPGFLTGIGDRGVRTLDQARSYIEERMVESYRLQGFGMWIVTPRTGEAPIGLAGLVKRDVIPHVDVGYAFLESAWGSIPWRRLSIRTTWPPAACSKSSACGSWTCANCPAGISPAPTTSPPEQGRG